MPSIETIYRQISAQKRDFLLAFFIIMVLSYGVLYAIDFIPEPVEQDSAIESSNATGESVVPHTVASTTPTEASVATTHAQTASAPAVVSATKYPVRIIFDKYDRTVPVSNPTSRAISDLDAGLLKGAVRHPDSADFEDTGNIFILGHSSYLPNVINKNFQSFNGIQKMSWGDTIRLQSADTEYTYRVDRVYEAKASDVTVPNSRGTAKLTLATCNSFGTKEDRFVLEATLIDTQAL